MTARSGYGGWPLVPSENRPGETALACKVCGSTDVKLTGAYAVRGTGPNGRGRLGDPGGREWAECNACGARGDLNLKLRFVIYLDNLEERDGMAMVTVHGDGARQWAKDDQTIDGSRWEGADGDDFAYALVMDRAGLVAELQKAGYELDLDDYCPPTPNNRGNDARG